MTLRSLPNTMLGRMFNEQNESLQKPQPDGSFYFDRNGRLFETVLDAYRCGGELLVPENALEREKLNRELEFWGFQQVEPIDERAVFRAPLYTFSLVLKRDYSGCFDALLRSLNHVGYNNTAATVMRFDYNAPHTLSLTRMSAREHSDYFIESIPRMYAVCKVPDIAFDDSSSTFPAESMQFVLEQHDDNQTDCLAMPQNAGDIDNGFAENQVLQNQVRLSTVENSSNLVLETLFSRNVLHCYNVVDHLYSPQALAQQRRFVSDWQFSFEFCLRTDVLFDALSQSEEKVCTFRAGHESGDCALFINHRGAQRGLNISRYVDPLSNGTDYYGRKRTVASGLHSVQRVWLEIDQLRNIVSDLRLDFTRCDISMADHKAVRFCFSSGSFSPGSFFEPRSIVPRNSFAIELILVDISILAPRRFTPRSL